MIVPVFNEGKIIHNKIGNLLELNYPKSNLEVIFVDGSSTDNTADIISEYATNHPFISLVRQGNRKGYNAAVFDGFQKSTGEIIVITQVDALYDPRPTDFQALQGVPGIVITPASTAQCLLGRVRVDIDPWGGSVYAPAP